MLRLGLFFVLVASHWSIADNTTEEIFWQRELDNHPAWEQHQKYECGISASDRIIGGVNAALGQFPWIARLGYLAKETGEIDFMCGGALVTDMHVVTAAHCVVTPDDDFKLTTIRLGEHDTRTDPDCELGVCAPKVQDRGIKAIRSHRSFNKPAFHNDIALIELSAPVSINDYVTPICLPRRQQSGILRLHEILTVAGWGTMNMSTEARAKILQVVSIPVLKPEDCDKFGKAFNIDSSAICAGAQFNKDACGGDSGGPLMKVFDSEDGPKYYLVGVVSFGPTVCGIKKPGVYTSVPYYIKWILESILNQ